MKQIALTQGKFALVDDADFEYLNQFHWCYSNSGYAMRYKAILMHREILGTPKGFDTDHINYNKLDNRRSNLRIATKSQNQSHSGLRKDNTSGATGVYWDKRAKKWFAQIYAENKKIHLGYFLNIGGAILARKWGEKLYLKEFANINI